jgi:fimbrial isopeptide formation D2 family protein
VLPPEVDFYESITIVDDFDADLITFEQILSLHIGGDEVDNPETLMTTSPGRVSVTLTPAHFTNEAGKTVALVLEFTVDSETRGIVRNEARIFVKTIYDGEPDESDGASIEMIAEVGTNNIIYRPNWPGGRQGSGTAPEDYNVYAPTDLAEVKGNEGDLAALGYEFLGWSSNPNATEPEFETDDEILMDGRVELYGVWRLKPVLNKTPSSAMYSPHDTVEYTIYTRMPLTVANYDSVRIEDVIPAGLIYAGHYELIIGDDYIATGVELQEGMLDGMGTLYVDIDGSLLLFSEGRDVRLTLRFTVAGNASWDIVNTANVYFTPIGEPKPGPDTIPNGSGNATIRPRPSYSSDESPDVIRHTAVQQPLPPSPPPAPQPSPQTGDNRQTTRHIMMLMVGFGLLSSTILYWLRHKIFYKYNRSLKHR